MAHGIQQADRAQHIGAEGLDRRRVRAPHQGLRRQMKHHFGLRLRKNSLQRRAIRNICMNKMPALR